MGHTEISKLPAELPVDGKGYGKRMQQHLNFGRAGGAAFYIICDSLGNKMPITYQYDTRKKADYETGFFIDGVDECFKSWKQVADYWPTYIKSIAPDNVLHLRQESGAA